MAKFWNNEFPLFQVESPPICKIDEKRVGDNPNLFGENLKKKYSPIIVLTPIIIFNSL